MAAFAENYAKELLDIGIRSNSPAHIPDYIVLQERVRDITNPSTPQHFFLHKQNLRVCLKRVNTVTTLSFYRATLNVYLETQYSNVSTLNSGTHETRRPSSHFHRATSESARICSRSRALQYVINIIFCFH